eukprot:CAMPEP_0206060096 /NCGR_PEP_ID=MMETSP1466-20131121/50446_1 /ASSEMBLY_ACC=CAM_ASM_001126 /TAXON_ID=44452 /ORGANISM="Pavlova gyrans, Strain CCMP608" /LENGTH=129 /DNA_ID=CAMNT_0053435429 /DNA_START=15 /DNA_END=401 /DNA_ORIENTATION=-
MTDYALLADVVTVSSEVLPECSARNVLHDDDRKLWLSEPGLPQDITLRMPSGMSKPICVVGLYCWHTFHTNPRHVAILSSADGKHFVMRMGMECELTDQVQLFQLEGPIPFADTYIKVLFRSTFGGERT